MAYIRYIFIMEIRIKLFAVIVTWEELFTEGLILC